MKARCPVCGGVLVSVEERTAKKCLTCCYCPARCGYISSPDAPGPCSWRCPVLMLAAASFGKLPGRGSRA